MTRFLMAVLAPTAVTMLAACGNVQERGISATASVRVPATQDARQTEGATTFFGTASGAARKILYVVDGSGSMTDYFDCAKYELKRSISRLDEGKEFHVIFFSSGTPVEMRARGLVPATARNKQAALEFVDGMVAQGETDPSEALERAFVCKPDLIYLLSDDEFEDGVVHLVGRLNAGRKVTVHTFGFIWKNAKRFERSDGVVFKTVEKAMRQIAEQNGGMYKFVSHEDLPKPPK